MFRCNDKWRYLNGEKGMARPEWTHTKPRNEVSPVPQIQGKAKHGKENAKPIIEGSSGPDQKVFH